ncbi:helix-turn-helix domain-containing protein [Aureimonas ureilytica]|uniref:helix-turn-helix domain-containing protein n=1 Tax=Aureimonas ureilytica TaxID=401562 RepID=UPI00037899E8|nr:helix-turn-helix domain-containing protein [Aureimonas ureilytica]
MNDRLPSLRLSSDKIGPRNALRLWREALPQFRTDLNGRSGDDFFVDVSAWLLGSMILCSGHLSSVRLSREPDQLMDGQNHVCLLYVAAGQWQGEIDGYTVRCQAGDILCLDSSHTFHLTSTLSRYVFLILPREALTRLMAKVPSLHGRILRSPSGHVLAAHLDTLSRYVPSLTEDEAGRISRGSLSLIGAALCEIEDSPLSDKTSAPLLPAVRMRVERYIEQNLSSHDLTPDTISRDLGIARSSLYRAFSSLGGISSHIQLRRLDTACELLFHPEEHRSVGELAETLGFESTATFSKAFRRRFGCSPREARTSGVTKLGTIRSMFDAWCQLGETAPAPAPAPKTQTRGRSSEAPRLAAFA